jgi:hypothetical protein
MITTLVKTFVLKIDIGDTTVSLRCWDEELAGMLRAWCGEFRSRRQADFWLEIELREGLTVAEVQQAVYQMIRRNANGQFFRSYPPVLESELSLREHWLKSKADRNLFHPAIQPRFLNVLLSSVYSTVRVSQNGLRGEAFLFHGCGVDVDGRGYLFTGPSRAGKTTVARLAAERTVLNDEGILLRISGDRLWMGGTPLLGGINRRCARWVPVQAILMLEHGPEVKLCRLETGDAFRRFLCQIFAPTPLAPDLVEQKRLLEEQVDFSARVLEWVPIYTLRFRPDGSFWPAVEAL